MATTQIRKGQIKFVGVKALGSGTVCNNNTETFLAWNTEEFDTDGFHDNVTNNSRLTVPAGLGGIYQFTCEANIPK